MSVSVSQIASSNHIGSRLALQGRTSKSRRRKQSDQKRRHSEKSEQSELSFKPYVSKASKVLSLKARPRVTKIDLDALKNEENA